MDWGLGRRGWEGAKRLLRTVLFDSRCQACSTPLVLRGEEHVCRECRGKIRPYSGISCRFCGKFMASGGDICGSCAIRRPPFLFHASYAPYQEPLKTIIQRYKYGGIQPLGRLLASLYLDLYTRVVEERIDLVVPVPEDPARKREFSPVGTAARLLARKLSLPCPPQLLVKVRSTRPQAGLDQKERARNLSRAFALFPGADLAGKRVLLLDDVFTTGATLGACARMLSSAGARVIGLTIAQSCLGDFIP